MSALRLAGLLMAALFFEGCRSSGVAVKPYQAGDLTTLGYFLGEISVVKNNLEIAAVVIVAVSLLPIAIEWRKHRLRAATESVSPN